MRINKFSGIVAILLVLAMLCLSGCYGVYTFDESKKSYDKGYKPTEREPSALTDETVAEIEAAAATHVNAVLKEEFDKEMEAYTVAVEADTAAQEADATAAEEAEEEGVSYVSTYKPAELIAPEEPKYKAPADVRMTKYGGIWSGYTAVSYKVKDVAKVAARNPENITHDVIGNYDFSFYPDSPNMALYKEGQFFTINEVFEAGGIDEQNIKDIWYYFYIEE